MTFKSNEISNNLAIFENYEENETKLPIFHRFAYPVFRKIHNPNLSI